MNDLENSLIMLPAFLEADMQQRHNDKIDYQFYEAIKILKLNRRPISKNGIASYCEGRTGYRFYKAVWGMISKHPSVKKKTYKGKIYFEWVG